MIKPEMVPESAWQQASGLWFNGATWPQIIAAALNAWPGMHHYEPNAEPYYGKHLILPLPQEGGDAEA